MQRLWLSNFFYYRENVDGSLIAIELSAIGSIGIHGFIKYFKYFGVFYLTLLTIGYIFGHIFQILSSVWLAKWSVREHKSDNQIRDYYLGMHGALGLAQGTRIWSNLFYSKDFKFTAILRNISKEFLFWQTLIQIS